MPMIETNLETVRNPTNLFVGGCQLTYQNSIGIHGSAFSNSPMSRM